MPEKPGFPRHRAAASLKRGRGARVRDRGGRRGFPRHRAAASLKPLRPAVRGREDGGFPRHRAAASLKHGAAAGRRGRANGGFPRHRAAASLKRAMEGLTVRAAVRFSAASGRGLIEARRSVSLVSHGPPFGFPRHRAAASLKRDLEKASYANVRERFSAASGRGLIEAPAAAHNGAVRRRFSAASGRGLIEAVLGPGVRHPGLPGFPRHRAAASLKQPAGRKRGDLGSGFPRHRAAASLKRIERYRPCARRPRFSAASGRGLIEAAAAGCRFRRATVGFPRHRAAASLKRLGLVGVEVRPLVVFRGIGPRPH